MTSSQVLILGGTGYVGSNVSKYLSSLNYDVKPLGRKKCDLTTIEGRDHLIELLSEKPSHVVFLAALTRSVSETSDSCFYNINQVESFLYASSKAAPLSVCFMSAADIYGHGGRQVSELGSYSVENPYGMYKLFSENILKFGLKSICPLSILRFSGVFGGQGDQTSLIFKFSKAIVDNKQITLHSNGEVYRDYLPVSLLSKVIELVIKSPCNETFNVSCGEDISIIKLVKLIEASVDNVAKLSLLKDVRSRDFSLSLSNKKLIKKFPILSDYDLLEEISLFVKTIH
ncbi:NAD-dependent epimerase/dehydratase family protein [Candidatus Thioglobus sp.]|nr:NAD-dependent epimerase/dehydratase family protein [Candidatus Thioglobus sp.]